MQGPSDTHGEEVPTPSDQLPIEVAPDEAQQPADTRMAEPAPLRPPGLDQLTVVDVHDLDWHAVGLAADPALRRAGMRDTVERLESLLDQAGGPGLLFDGDRAHADDRALRVSPEQAHGRFWLIGDLHGDLLALEAALALARQVAGAEGGPPPRLIFLGDFFDDEGDGLELLLRVYELILESPGQVCVLAGNHDEALSFDGQRFASTVSPSDFADFLNANRAHEWIERAGKLAVRLIAQAPRALFFPSGLLVSHAGFPLKDLHARLAETGDWNDPACLSDFVWTRLHAKARRKMPNRYSRGSQFGVDDFADFCALSTQLGRPVTHLVRGHDHVEERYAIPAAYQAHPVVTTIALSRRLPREQFGPQARVPTVVRVEGDVPGAQVHRLHLPVELVHGRFPPPPGTDADAAGAAT